MKKPLFQKIRLQENLSFNLLKVKRPFFKVPWHFHPEIEIMLIIKGEGTRFVGDSIGHFEEGDLVMVGANLSHVWKNADLHYQNRSEVLAEARVILFREDCFGKDFFGINETSRIQELIKRAGRGVLFRKETAFALLDSFNAACEEALPCKKMIAFLSILHALAEEKNYELLASAGYLEQSRNFDLERLNQVLDYTILHYREPIRLQEAAKQAHLSVPAFCRYFKKRTNKTFVEFVNELRIGYAHRRLIETQNTISQICFESGYGQLSNFYKQFQIFTGASPLEYRKKHEKKQMAYADDKA